ncbi:MAG: peptidase C39 family protein [Candidatus Micrarchaeaceae archaeon]
MRTRDVYVSVPFYQQAYEFTCGPACLMMVFKHFEKSFEMSKVEEMNVWRESVLAPLTATSRYGLAYSALRRGFEAYIKTNVKGIEFIKKERLTKRGKRNLNENLEMIEMLFKERRARARALGLIERRGNVRMSEIRSVLLKGGLPIILTNLKYFEDEGSPHWVLVVGFVGGKVIIHDPGSKVGNKVFTTARFNKLNGFHGDEVLIAIFPEHTQLKRKKENSSLVKSSQV